MNYFNDEENVNEYLRMSDGYDGKELVDKLSIYLPEGAAVLELGMGPGKDLNLLKEKYSATGSDNSEIFLNLYREKYPAADLLNLDAVTIATDRLFDAIYSNKVLHHLTTDELQASFSRQGEIINPGGVVLHSFWRGEGQEFFDGLRFTYYIEKDLQELIPPVFKIIETSIYDEIEKGDSICLVLKRIDEFEG